MRINRYRIRAVGSIHIVTTDFNPLKTMQLYNAIDSKILKSNMAAEPFIGKNLVFDERMGESVNGEVISH